MHERPTAAPQIEDLGRADYGAVHRMMHTLVESIRVGGSAGKILLVEHDPVYTAGRATPRADLSAPASRGAIAHDAPPPIEIVEIERGGRITYHGLGQLVIYPIVPLPRRDVRAWLRAIENFGVAVCASFGLRAEPSVDGTGVFVGPHKVGSIGVAIRHWINYHGVAINVDMDLAPFHRIRPCGLAPDVMSDLSRAAGRPISMDAARAAARDAAPVLWAHPTRDTDAL